jgi:hypothetical protein
MEAEEKIAPVPAEAGMPPERGSGRCVKGQSGNPRGRPSRAHQAAWVGQHLIDRKIIELVDGAIGRAQVGDKPSARALLDRLVPPRREAPVWLKVAPIEDRAGVKSALKAVATAVAQGDIPPAQGLKLVRMYTELYRYL